jgi:hypothetical protein
MPNNPSPAAPNSPIRATPNNPSPAAPNSASPAMPDDPTQAAPKDPTQAMPNDPARAVPNGPAPAMRIGPAPAVPNGPVTFVGIGGLRWADIAPDTTPALWQVTRHSAAASLTVRAGRAGTCPIDGWLTLNSGTRSDAARPGGACAPIPAPGSGGSIAGWSTLRNSSDSVAERLGTLAGPTPDRADCAVGPGAAVALAGGDGTLAAGWFPDATSLPDRCDLLLVDGGALPRAPADRAARLKLLDGLVAVVAARVWRGTLVVAGISDSLATAGPDGRDAAGAAGRGRPAAPELTAVAVAPPGDGYDPAHRPLLRSASTEQDGLVQLTDLTPTLMRRTPPADLPGAPLQAGPGRAADRDLIAAAVAANTVRDIFVPFFVVFAGGQLVAWPVLLAWHRRRRDRAAAARAARAVGLWLGSVAPASFAVNLLPWSHWRHPAIVLWAAIGLLTTGLSVIAATGPWRRSPYGPAAAIGALTAAGLALDVATGSRRQLDALFGLSPLIAGRFYGFGNITFAVFAVCALTTAAAAATWAAPRFGRWPATAAAAAIGSGAALVDGWPGLGTDFGGFVSLLPGAAVLTLGVAGIRIRPHIAALVAAFTVIMITGIAVIDLRRPPERTTHLGRFAQQVIDGDGPSVIARKAAANLGLLHAPGTVTLAVPAIALMLLAVRAPDVLRLTGLARVGAADPIFRSLLTASLVTGLLGFALNDSGVIVPAVALTTGLPLFVTVWAARWRDLESP